MLRRVARWSAVALFLTPLALGQETEVVRDSREDWDVATIRTELGNISVLL